MFKRLKTKLILTNVAVVLVIFVVIFTSIYFMMYKNITKQSYQLMNILTINLLNLDSSKNPTFNKLMAMQPFIVADVDHDGKLLSYNGNDGKLPLSQDKLQELVSSAFKAPKKSDNLIKEAEAKKDGTAKAVITLFSSFSNKKITASDGSAYYCNIVKKSPEGISIIFINVTSEEKTIMFLRYALLTSGILGLLLTFLGSLYMANRALKPIKNSWEKQKGFVADASHELRTPLAVMQTNVELVMDNGDETVNSQRQWLENVHLETKRLSKLVSDLLILARADSDQQLLEKTNFRLDTAINEAVNPFLPVAEETGIELKKVIQSGIDFYGDRERIKQLAVILVDNAIKFTTQGCVLIELNNNVESIELIVKDSGEGIEEEDLKRIFERFYRADKSRNREDGSAGLGLSIADWIVKEHNGTIKAESKFGEGSTFRVRLPKLKHDIK
jgi:two-component system, OmpR family, sensor histidine kinase CiaH